MWAGPVMMASLPVSAHWKPLNSRGCSPNTSGFSCTVVDIAVTKDPVMMFVRWSGTPLLAGHRLCAKPSTKSPGQKAPQSEAKRECRIQIE